MSLVYRIPPSQGTWRKLRRRPWSDPPAIVPARNLDLVGSTTLPTADLTHSRADSAPVATYFDSSGVLQTASTGAPRFDNQYVGTGWRPRGLLLEESKQNLWPYNLDVSAGVTAGPTAIGNAALGNNITAPDGTASSMCQLIEDTTVSANGHYIFQQVDKTPGAAVTATVSAFIKDAGRACMFYMQNVSGGSGAWVVFDARTGVVTSTLVFGAWTLSKYKIVPIGNGEYIAEVSFITDTATDSVYYFGFYTTIYGTTTTLYTGDGTSGFHIWGINNELGLNRTSLIKNPGATLNTRPADIVTLAGTPLATVQAATMSVLIEAELNLNNPATNPVMLSDGTEEFQLFADNTVPDQAVSLWETSANRAQAVATFGGWSTAGRVFYSQDGSGHAISMDGGPVATSSYVPVVARTSVQIGSPPISIATQYATGWYKRLAFYTTRPTDAQIQALSGVGVPTLFSITSAAAAETVANFTSSATTALKVTATANQTIATFTSASAETLAVAAVANQTVANFTSVATATLALAETAAETVANFTSSSAATLAIAATANQTIAAFTSAAADTLQLTAAVNRTVTDFTSASAATLAIAATANNTVTDFTQSAAAAIGGGVISATANQTVADFSSSSAATLTLATVSNLSLAAFTSAGAEALRLAIAAAQTLTDFNSVATSTISIAAAANNTLAAFTSATAETLTITATANMTIAGMTSPATATLALAASANQTLAAFTSIAVASLGGAQAIVNNTVADFTQTAAATLKITATANQTLSAFNTASAALKIAATAAQTLAPFTSAGTIQVGVAAVATNTIANFTQSATGITRLPIVAITNQLVSDFTQSSTANLTVAALVNLTIGDIYVPHIDTNIQKPFMIYPDRRRARPYLVRL